MITLKQLNKLPTKIQMRLCNHTSIQNGLKEYKTDEILKLIDKELYNILLTKIN